MVLSGMTIRSRWARLASRAKLAHVFSVGAIAATLIPTFWYDLLGVGVAIDQFDAYLVCIPIYALLAYLTYRLKDRSLKACWPVALAGLLVVFPVLFYILIGLAWAISGFAP